MIRRTATAIADATLAVFGHAFMVVVTMLLSCASVLWAALAPSELTWTLFLSILAIAIESVILFSQRNAA